jgi:hypothetical protein
MPTCAVLLCFILWLQFLIFYLVSLPLNSVCNSRDVILNSNYTLPISISNGTSLVVNPATVISGCQNGASLFEVSFNPSGQNLESLASQVIAGYSSLGASFLSNSTLRQMIPLPDTSSQLSQVNSSMNLSAINLNVNFSAYQISFNVSSMTVQLTNISSQLSPATLDSNNGNMTAMSEQVHNFNALAAQAVSPQPFTPWTYNYIVSTYVIPNSTFVVSSLRSLPLRVYEIANPTVRATTPPEMLRTRTTQTWRRFGMVLSLVA